MKKTLMDGKKLIIALIISLLLNLGLIGYIIINDNDVNSDENMNFKYYMSEVEYGYRYSLTLGQITSEHGFFTIDVLNQFEGPSVSGHYNIENNKMILSINNNDGDSSLMDAVFNLVDATLVDDTDPSDGNYKTYELDYNNKELQIGSVKFYFVN